MAEIVRFVGNFDDVLVGNENRKARLFNTFGILLYRQLRKILYTTQKHVKGMHYEKMSCAKDSFGCAFPHRCRSYADYIMYNVNIDIFRWRHLNLDLPNQGGSLMLRGIHRGCGNALPYSRYIITSSEKISVITDGSDQWTGGQVDAVMRNPYSQSLAANKHCVWRDARKYLFKKRGRNRDFVPGQNSTVL